MRLAHQRLEALARAGSRLPGLLGAGGCKPGTAEESFPAVESSDDQLPRVVEVWRLIDRGEWHLARRALSSLGALRPGLESVRRDLAERVCAELASATCGRFAECRDPGGGPQAATDEESGWLPGRHRSEAAVPGATVSLALPVWLTRIQAWREVLGV